MNTRSTQLTIRGITVDVRHKPIKNLHIGVYPPDGRVRVAAPERLSIEQVRLAIIQRLPWIKRQRHTLQDAARQSRREMVSGESHYLWGQRLRLQIIERPGRADVAVRGNRLIMGVPPGMEVIDRTNLLQRWHREQLRDWLAPVIAHWEPVVGQAVPFWSIRKMKTRWGSCNPATGHIWFNLELVKKHPQCIEYIVVHELVHLIERHHNERFVALMDTFLADWRARRDELNRAPLAHEDWRY